MKSRPILFSAPMVRALLAGRKTQTRRVLKGTPPAGTTDFVRYHHPDDELGARPYWYAWGADPDRPGAECLLDFAVPCPYGTSGDLLWVRETWGVGSRPHPVRGWVDGIEYRADETPGECLDVREVEPPSGVDLGSFRPGWHPSIHMPRWASRITLRITDVRVERLQQISEADARAEGRSLTPGDPAGFFPETWNDIHGCGAWDANPWVWVVAFERVTEGA